jgi:hypothetical protein
VNAIRLVAYRGDSPVEVQFAAVMNGVGMVREKQVHVSKRLVGLLMKRHAHELARGQVLGFLLFSIKEELADFRQVFGRAFMLVFVRLAFPQGVFVELQMFIGNAAKEHAPEPAIADRKRLDPLLSRMLIPKDKRRGRRACQYAWGEQQGQAGNPKSEIRNKFKIRN